ncbi:hypothetical protein IDH44_09735 [Paenibacillus sp. IB182496]|uniref:Lipoprotein n=1 Tax=Paenibacillus sabuli TaxID=2772509 RepID=A0A927BTY3_9BACL|nr:hypothetical protein [Paenibacillus sabuli]MBD2845469.1 hypothetical protein [Paenibacillus sabuli]
MFGKRRMLLPLIALMIVVIAAGCSNGKAPKEAVQSALENSVDMKSYTFSADMQLTELELPPSAMGGGDQQAAAMIDTFKNAKLSMTGVYEADPMRMEMVMNIEVPGDMAFSLNVPFIMTEEKMYVKIPQTPMLPLGELAGKFVEVDLQELAAEAGTEMPTLNMDTQRQMSQDILNIFVKHFDEETYFTELKEGDVTLPEGVDPDQIVKFSVTQDNFDQMVMTLVQNVAPEVIDLFRDNAEYREALALQESDLEEAQAELNSLEEGELQTELDKMKESVTINELSMIGAIADDYMVYQQVNANLDVTQEGETAKIGLTINGQYDNINEDVEFTQDIPTDAIPFDELGMGTGMMAPM